MLRAPAGGVRIENCGGLHLLAWDFPIRDTIKPFGLRPLPERESPQSPRDVKSRRRTGTFPFD